MTLEAATCPRCGGALQVHSGQAMVRCQYCGVEVMLREDAQAAGARAKEANLATPIEQTREASLFGKVLLGLGAPALLLGIALMALTFDTIYGAVIMVIGLVLIMTGVANL